MALLNKPGYMSSQTERDPSVEYVVDMLKKIIICRLDGVRSKPENYKSVACDICVAMSNVSSATLAATTSQVFSLSLISNFSIILYIVARCMPSRRAALALFQSVFSSASIID